MRFSILAVIFLLIPPLTVQAGEGHEAAGRTISYRTAVEVLERDAENKPTKGTAERVGVTLHEKGPGAGSFSQVRIETAWERTAKGGVYAGKLHRVLPNGDEQRLVFEGKFGKGWSKGTYECEGGTGKYAAAKCSGIYEGQSFSNRMAANQWSGTIEFTD